MPDQNVAEALQRLPGIQMDRSGQNGQGNTVLIDGLRQNLTTFNGDVFLTGKEFTSRVSLRGRRGRQLAVQLSGKHPDRTGERD